MIFIRKPKYFALFLLRITKLSFSEKSEGKIYIKPDINKIIHPTFDQE
jgi:hypothetical protein